MIPPAPSLADRPIPPRLLVLLGALIAFGPLSIDLYLPALPDLAGDLHSSSTAAQLTMSACMVGLAFGQLLFGPVSDGLGRRRPLLAGIGAYAVLSLLCAMAPNVEVLVGLRLLQGLAGGAGIVIARAIVRDLCDTETAARVFSLLMLIMGVAPVVAPLAGGQLLRVTSWPGLFVVLAGVGAVLLVASGWTVPESLPVERRRTGGLRASGGQFAALLRDPRFLGFAAVYGFGAAIQFTHIVMSPFVMQRGYGLSPQSFSYVFAANAAGMVAAGRLGAWLVPRIGAKRVLRTGLTTATAAGCAMLASVHFGLPAVLPAMWLVVSAVALIMPNATALALDGHGSRAGTASGVLGLIHFGVGATVPPLVSAGATTATAMAATMAAAGALGLFVNRLIGRAGRDRRGRADLPGVKPRPGPRTARP